MLTDRSPNHRIPCPPRGAPSDFPSTPRNPVKLGDCSPWTEMLEVLLYRKTVGHANWRSLVKCLLVLRQLLRPPRFRWIVQPAMMASLFGANQRGRLRWDDLGHNCPPRRGRFMCTSQFLWSLPLPRMDKEVINSR